MRLMAWLLTVSFILTGWFSTQAFAADPGGQVTALTGLSTLTRSGSTQSLPVKIGDAISLGDKIETGSDATIRVTFADGAEISLGENGVLLVDEFVYTPETKTLTKARYSILRAAFIYAGGAYTDTTRPDVEIKVDFGSIGIRGTTLYRGMRDQECWIYLEEGAVTVSNEGGQVNLAPGDMTRISSTAIAPSGVTRWQASDLDWIKVQTGNK